MLQCTPACHLLPKSLSGTRNSISVPPPLLSLEPEESNAIPVYFPMLIRCSGRTWEGLHSLFRQCGGCHPSLQIAIPYVPSTVTRSFHAFLPHFPSAGCLRSTSWQLQVSSSSYRVYSRCCQCLCAGRGRGSILCLEANPIPGIAPLQVSSL